LRHGSLVTTAQERRLPEKEGKRKAEGHVTELATRDKLRTRRLSTTQGTDTGNSKMESMKTKNWPQQKRSTETTLQRLYFITG